MFDTDELTEISGLDLEEELPADLAAALKARGKLKHFPEGRTVIAQGTDASDVYLIANGSVKFYVSSSNGKETSLRQMGRGRLFGEMAALGDKRRSVNAEAIDDIDVWQISGPAFTAFLKEVPGAGYWLAKLLAARVRDLTEKCSDLATLPVSARIQKAIMSEARKVPRDGDRCEIRGFMTHAELAARIGSHREAVTRELGDLEREGILTRSKRTLTIHSLVRLQRLIDRAAAG